MTLYFKQIYSIKEFLNVIVADFNAVPDCETERLPAVNPSLGDKLVFTFTTSIFLILISSSLEAISAKVVLICYPISILPVSICIMLLSKIIQSETKL